MSNISRGKMYESLAWILFAALAYYFSFGFEKEIEIYKFGASGWPRAIILLTIIAAVMMLFTGNRESAIAAAEGATEEEIKTKRTLGNYLHTSAILAWPVLYAVLMEKIGFYTLTPFFIFGFLWLAGEHRLKILLMMSIGIYVFFVFVFGRLLYINLPVGTMHPFYDFSNWLLVIIR